MMRALSFILAAALCGRLPVSKRVVAVTLTGANVDPAMYQRALSTGG